VLPDFLKLELIVNFPLKDTMKPYITVEPSAGLADYIESVHAFNVVRHFVKRLFYF
jgi:hypothetical protein